ncbi:hypothetical protein BKA69DRAFT_685081 [Paraphysoderma sedebokerense]|nr:hypothetical protein BKA69DRAFT_685081 [Paraphysoderma sedebokerense]
MAVWGRLHQCSEGSNAEAKQVNRVVFRSESLDNPEDLNIDDTTTGKEEGKKKRKLVILESESEKEEMGDLENQPVRDFSKRVKIESIPNSLHSTSSSSESLLMGSDSDMHPGSTSSSSYVQEPLMVQPSALKLVPSFTHKLLGLCHPKLKQNEINHLESINEAVQCALVAGEWDSEELMWNEISMLQTKTNEKLGETVDTTMDKLQDIVNALDCHSFMDAFVAPSEARRMQIFEIDQYTPQADDVITSPSTISWFKPPKWSDHLTTDLEIEATLKCMNLQLLSTKTGFGKSVEPGQDNGQEVASNVLRGVKALGVDQ